MKKTSKPSFADFLSFFPEIDLPITLTEESQIQFSRHNKALNESLTQSFILENEMAGERDEYTEYVPCFRIKETTKFHAVVFWKASLLTYEYLLATYTEKGEMINKRVIAGTKSTDGTLVRSVATIDEDWIIHIVGGVADSKDEKFEATHSQSFNFELLANGQIIMSN